MYSTIIHPLRKVYLLSCNDFVVLDTVYQLSHNEKFGGWCVASKDNIAQWLDLSRPTIFRTIETLIAKGLVIKNENGWLRTTDEWNEKIANKHDWVLGFNGKESSFFSAKVQSQNDTDSLKMIRQQSQNDTPTSIKMRPNNNKDNNINNIYAHSSLSGLVRNESIEQRNIKNVTKGLEKESCAKEKDDRFIEFWELYPRKLSKGVAQKAWRRLSEEQKQLAIEALPSHIQQESWKEYGGKYIPYPASWLNGMRWEDSLQAATPPPRKYKTDEDYEKEFKKLTTQNENTRNTIQNST